jgi:hypothetical protein
MATTEQSLVGQIMEQVQALPQDLRKEVLDFVGYLHARYQADCSAERDQILAATFGSWEDERAPKEIIRDIYAQRTVSDVELKL